MAATKLDEDTPAIRQQYAVHIVNKLPSDLREQYRADIHAVVAQAERLEYAQKLAALSAEQIIEVVKVTRSEGHLS